MAYEPSEGLYAGLSLVSTQELNSAKTNANKFLSLYEVALKNLQGNKVIDAPGDATKNGMISVITLDGKSAEEKQKIYSDLAAALSAVIGTRSKIKSVVPSKVYLTGNKWHSDIEKFKVKAFGMSDYNSSDVILGFNHNDYVGISLKKKPNAKAESPTLINNAFSKFIEGKELSDVREKLNKHRIKFFASVIKEACQQGGPLYGLARVVGTKTISSLNPDNDADAKTLWDMKVTRQKSGGKTEQIALINLKSETELADRDGLVKKTGAAPSQVSFRNFVNKKLQSKGGSLNKLYKGFLDIMNEDEVKNTLADALLNRVLKTSLLDELDIWKDNEFGFYLVEGVGTVNKELNPNISSANISDIHSIMIAIAKLSKQDAKIELDTQKTFARNAAKVFFTLSKGDTPILQIELRYKGSFTAYPQFFAGMTKEFKDLVKKGDIGI